MLAYLKTYGFSLLMLTAFLSHQFVEPFATLPLIDSYLDDLCFLPVAFGFIQFIVHHSIDESYRLNWKQALIGAVITTLATEVLFPYLSNKHVADPYDTIAYTIGALLFMIFGNKQFNNTAE
jgi:hypothetical protein